MSNKLNSEQKIIYNFLKKKIRAYGQAPSIEEICIKTNLISPAVVKENLSKLEELGFIALNVDDKTPIKILEEGFYTFDIPSTNIKNKDGKVYENIPVFTLKILQETTPSIIKFLKHHQYFLVKKLDDSMTKIGISPESMILIESNSMPEKAGDIILAFVEEKVILRAIFKNNENFILKAGDPNIADIISNDVTHLGKLIHVFNQPNKE